MPGKSAKRHGWGVGRIREGGIKRLQDGVAQDVRKRRVHAVLYLPLELQQLLPARNCSSIRIQ